MRLFTSRKDCCFEEEKIILKEKSDHASISEKLGHRSSTPAYPPSWLKEIHCCFPKKYIVVSRKKYIFVSKEIHCFLTKKYLSTRKEYSRVHLWWTAIDHHPPLIPVLTAPPLRQFSYPVHYLLWLSISLLSFCLYLYHTLFFFIFIISRS